MSRLLQVCSPVLFGLFNILALAGDGIGFVDRCADLLDERPLGRGCAPSETRRSARACWSQEPSLDERATRMMRSFQAGCAGGPHTVATMAGPFANTAG